ncbi:HAD family hydrolase [Roseibium aggregatum]|uniref:HAD family phosphatase n=1 Tax=Roseibium aggregatum TaxID=187304 RepID=A0A939E926_9HYPH|nr:HAD family phosphatase [Roseibium aggregatum]MBN9668852.1 HAD family phosphatase [Roseibium aggregatum]
MNAPVTTVVFDIGNVLIEWNPDYLYRRLIPDAQERKIFLETICTPDWNLQQDMGRSWAEAVETLSRKHPEHSGLIAAYSEHWQEMVPGEVPGTPAILRELKEANVPLFAITNFSSEKFAEAEIRFPFLADSFLDVVVSGHERQVKPGSRIYEILCERNGLSAQSCFFIDDSEPNVATARRLGMTAHHFKTADALRRELETLGLLSAD